MKRFKKILLICDEKGMHNALLERAINLAKVNGAAITLVDVVESAPGELSRVFGLLPGAKPRDIEAEIITHHSARLAKFAAPIRAAGVETKRHVLQGIGFVQIIKEVLNEGYDLVMKGSAGGGDQDSPTFASTDLHLLRKCPCPVWIMDRDQRERHSTIVAAIDPMIDSQNAGSLNRLIMDLATSLADAEGSTLSIVSAWQLDEEETLRHGGLAHINDTDVDIMAEKRRSEAEHGLNDLLRHYPDTAENRQVDLVKGQARRVISDVVGQKSADLIIMGTVGRTDIEGLIIGNTAEAVLGRVNCSVLAVKPPGFESPIRQDSTSQDVDALAT
jgi:nucleotide-binding universal stress UspA family protein